MSKLQLRPRIKDGNQSVKLVQFFLVRVHYCHLKRRGITDELDQLMVACDVAITKGTYCTGRELEALGIPTIVLSHGRNRIDDYFSRMSPRTTFHWISESSASELALAINSAFLTGLHYPEAKLLGGGAAGYVASHLDAWLCP